MSIVLLRGGLKQIRWCWACWCKANIMFEYVCYQSVLLCVGNELETETKVTREILTIATPGIQWHPFLPI